MGETGAKGAKGDTGATGSPGPKGSTGALGTGSKVICKNTAAAKSKCALYFPSYAWAVEGSKAASVAAFAVRHGSHIVARGRVRLSNSRQAKVSVRPHLRRGTYSVTVRLASGQRIVWSMKIK